MKSRSWIFLALAAAAAGALWWLLQEAAAGRAMAGAAGTAGRLDEASTVAAEPIARAAAEPDPSSSAAGRQAVQESSGPAGSEATPTPPTAGTLGYGSLYGVLYAAEGAEMVGHRLLFSSEDHNLPARSVTTGDHGSYLATGLAAGFWQIYYLGPADGTGSAGGSLAAVAEVVADHALPFDVVLEGGRSLSGYLKVPEVDGLGLRLELRPIGLLQLTAYCVAVTRNAFDAPPPPPQPGSASPEDDLPPAPQVSGAFRMAGLLPGRYRLRLLLDADGMVFLDREIDLSEGDLILEESLKVEDFLR